MHSHHPVGHRDPGELQDTQTLPVGIELNCLPPNSVCLVSRWGNRGTRPAGQGLGLGPHPAQAPGQSSHHLLIDKVDGAAHIDVHEVHVNGAVEELGTFGHGVRERALQLHQEGGVCSVTGCPTHRGKARPQHIPNKATSSRANTNLHPEYVLTGMAFEQSPLRHLSLEQVCAHGHLTAGHIRAEALANTAKG